MHTHVFRIVGDQLGVTDNISWSVKVDRCVPLKAELFVEVMRKAS